MKLQNKIFVLFTIAISVVFSIAFTILGKEFFTFNKNITENLNTQLIDSKALEASNWLTTRTDELRLINYASKNMDEESLHSFINQINEALNDEYGNNYGTFAIGGTDGLGYVTETQNIDISKREYFKQAMSGNEEYVISRPVRARTDGTSIILLCYPILDSTGNKTGFVNGAVSLDRLTEITENIDFYDGHSYIVDSNGNLYTNTNISKDTYDDITQTVPDLFPDKTKTVDYISKQDGQKKVAFYTPIPSTKDWYLLTIVEKSKLSHEITTLMSSLVAIWIILLLISFIISYIISNTVTKPVQKLSGAMKEIEKGNFDVSVYQKGSDEIATLAQSFDHMVIVIDNLLQQVYIEQNEASKLRYQVLQSQIKPHFLYNTLDTLQWKAMEYENSDEFVELITALSSFFRISLSGGKDFITLDKEVEHVRNYLIIQQYRYQDILGYTIKYDSTLGNTVVDKLIIQPIVENAIYHGIKPKLSYGTISINIYLDGEDIKIVVSDDGVGMSPQKLEEMRTHLKTKHQGDSLGLYNVHQRLSALYGENYGVSIESELGKGTSVTITVPTGHDERKDNDNSCNM